MADKPSMPTIAERDAIGPIPAPPQTVTTMHAPRSPGDESPRRSTRAIPADVPGSSVRWWVGTAAASVVALPLAWLLSYAAALPFYLGVFFFMLFGLVIGATAYRVASRGRPYRTPELLMGTTWLVGLVFGLSLWKESRDFPAVAAERVSPRAGELGDRGVGEYRRAIAEDVRRSLSERYPPGGVTGYVRWALTDGRLNPSHLTVIDRGIAIPASQTRFWWALRVVLSIGFLAFGIGSQTLLLHRVRDSEGDGRSPDDSDTSIDAEAVHRAP